MHRRTGHRDEPRENVPKTNGIDVAAKRLLDAARSRVPCPPVRDLLPDGSAATAYAVQSVLTQDRMDRDRRIVGRKIGLTSPSVQQQLGVDQPDFGVLFDDMVVPTGSAVDTASLLQPRIEAEIAFVLDTDLDGPHFDLASVRTAVARMVPALEIVDSRIARWDITFADTVADNASSGMFVLGETELDLGDADLREIDMNMVDGQGQTVSSGSGAACLGDPLHALLWLARTCYELGTPLRSGDIVLSGALGPMVPVTAGTSFSATLSGLGTVTTEFSGDRGGRT